MPSMSKLPQYRRAATQEKQTGPPGDEESHAEGPSSEDLAEIEQEEPADLDGLADGLPAGDSAGMYLKEIGRIPLLAPDEEARLARAVSAGGLARESLSVPNADPDPEVLDELEKIAEDGDRAKDKLAEANLRLVASVARRYLGCGMPFLDLVQEGSLGLLKAADRFDYTKGYKFSTYATWWIRQRITRAIANQARTVRVPVHVAVAIGKVGRASQELAQELGREPSPEEIAERLELPAEKIRKIMEAARQTVSLDAPVGEEEDNSLGDFISDGSAADPGTKTELSLLREQMADVLGTLQPREEEIIRLRFGIDDGRPRTLEEIGQRYGVTRERVRQIEAKAMRKLRHPTRSRKLKDFIE